MAVPVGEHLRQQYAGSSPCSCLLHAAGRAEEAVGHLKEAAGLFASIRTEGQPDLRPEIGRWWSGDLLAG
ncbi:MAG: hypothetical protein ACYCUG_16980 [Acidimicrobiales bacterium]